MTISVSLFMFQQNSLFILSSHCRVSSFVGCRIDDVKHRLESPSNDQSMLFSPPFILIKSPLLAIACLFESYLEDFLLLLKPNILLDADEPNENEVASPDAAFVSKHCDILLEQPIGPILKLNGNSIEELLDDTDEASGGVIGEVPINKSFIRPGDDELDLLTNLNGSCCCCCCSCRSCSCCCCCCCCLIVELSKLHVLELRLNDSLNRDVGDEDDVSDEDKDDKPEDKGDDFIIFLSTLLSGGDEDDEEDDDDNVDEDGEPSFRL